MSSITRSYAVHNRVTAPLRVVSDPAPVPSRPDDGAEQPEVAERVRASAHVAAGVAGVELSASAPTAADGTDPGTGLRFLGAGWAADAAVFAQYRRRGN